MPAEPPTYHLAARLRRRELERKVLLEVSRVLREANGSLEEARAFAGVTAPGDRARLRGLPAVGRGVGGAMRGTVPHVDGLR